MSTHADLIQASQAIGSIAESADWYTKRLAERIGWAEVYSLTVGELIRLDTQLRDEATREHTEGTKP